MLPSVPDFLRLFCEATCVLTDSFHATAFALNLGIDFISILPSNYGTRIERHYKTYRNRRPNSKVL
ncbi:MAG: polysaccharide pyruvyl transferase family protein [Ruminococcus sp.]